MDELIEKSISVESEVNITTLIEAILDSFDYNTVNKIMIRLLNDDLEEFVEENCTEQIATNILTKKNNLTDLLVEYIATSGSASDIAHGIVYENRSVAARLYDELNYFKLQGQI